MGHGIQRDLWEFEHGQHIPMRFAFVKHNALHHLAGYIDRFDPGPFEQRTGYALVGHH